MAKGKDDSSLDDIDSILASLEGDDMDFGLDTESQPKNKREAITQSLKDGSKGFVEHFKSEPVEKIKKFVETAIPRGIQPEMGFVSNTVNELKDVFQKDAKELRNNSKDLIDIVKSKMPDNSGVKKILDKISSKLGVDNSSGPRYYGPSQDEMIAETLDNLFKQKDARESTREAISEVKDKHKFEHESKLSGRIIENLELKNDFDRNITLNYYKKSIELKMKSMLISKELLETTKVGYDGFKVQFEALIKNTSLPDLIKLKNSEQTKEAFKQRFRENLTDMFFATATPLENMKKNIIQKSRDIISQLSSYASMGLMGASMGDMYSGMGGMMGSKSQMAGAGLGSWVSNVAGEFANKELGENQTVRDKMRKMKLMFADPKDAFYGMSTEEADKNTLFSRFKARLYKSVGMLAETKENDRLKIRENAPDEATFFDYRTKNSIVKIIPMILSKIYGEVRAARTGEEPSGIYYDYTTGKLEENNNIKSRFKNNIKGALSGVAGSNLEALMGLLENEEYGNTKLDDETRNEFKSAILSYLVKDGTISPKGLEKDKFLKMIPEDKRKEFQARYEKVMEQTRIDVKLIDDIKDTLYNIKANTPFIDKVVEDMYKNGNIEEIVKMGILDYDDKEGIYTVNKDKYQELLDSSLKEMGTYDSSSFKPNTTTSDIDPNEDNLSKIFKDSKDALHKKANEKFDIDGKLDSLKDISSEDLKDPIKRKLFFKKLRARGKRARKSLSGKVDELKENVNLIAEMTPEEIKEYLLSKENSLEEWVDNKAKTSTALLEKQYEKIRSTNAVKTSEENINNFIKQHRLKGKYNLLRKSVINKSLLLNEKYGLDNKIQSGQNLAKESFEKAKEHIGMFKLYSKDIEHENRLAIPQSTSNDFSTFKFESSQSKSIRDTKLKDLLSLDKVDAEKLHDFYKTSAEHVSGIDFLTWARSLRFKFVNGEFIKMPEDVKFENLRSTVVEYLEKQAQGIFNKDKKDKFSGIKSIFGIEAGMTPLQILSKVLKKTRAWDRKIMFEIVPKAMGKVFKFPFKAIKAGGKAIYNGVFNRNTMNFARVLAGLDPIYPDKEKGKLSTVKAGLDKTRELDKKIVKGAPGMFGKILKSPFAIAKMSKEGIGAGWDWLNGRPAKKKEKPKEEKNIFDNDGDGDIDGSWKDQLQQAKDKKPKEEKNIFDNDGDGDIDGSWKDQLQQAKDKKPKDDKIINLNLPKEKKDDNGIWGMLLAGLMGIKTILGKSYSFLKAIPVIGKGIGFLGGILKKGFNFLGKPLLGLATKLGILGLGGKVASEVAEGVGTKVATGLTGEALEKAALKGAKDVDVKDIKKPDNGKIMNALKSFKDKIVAKLGPKASIRVLGTLSTKIASRLVPIAGLSLLAYDAFMIAKDMLQNNTSFISAVSRQILGYDLFNDDEPILDEDGNPVKPDEMSGEEFAKDSLIQEYLEKSKLNPEEANKFREENGLSMEDISAGVNKKKAEDAYKNSTEYSEAFQKAMNTKNVLNKSGKTLGETYGKGLDMSSGTFNLSKSKEAVGKMLDDVAKQTGVDSNLLKTFAAIESGMNPTASAGSSSAKGLFQFIDSTWKDMLNKYGSKYGIEPGTSVLDPMANALMGAEYLKENSKIISSVKKDVTPTDLYMAHFLGAGGAKQFLKADPNVSGAGLLPSAASANPTIFYKNGVPRTVGEIYQFLQNLVARRAKEYGFSAGTPSSESTTPESNNSNASTNTPSSTAPVTSGTPTVSNDNFSKDMGNTKDISNVPKTPTTNDMTSGFVPTTKTITPQSEVDFNGSTDILKKSLEVQSSMDGTLKTILNKIIEMSNGKTSTTPPTETPKVDNNTKQSLDSPEAVIDLTKKRF